MILTPLQKLPKNVGDLGKLIVAKALNGCPKSNKSPNLVTLLTTSAVGGNCSGDGCIGRDVSIRVTGVGDRSCSRGNEGVLVSCC